VSLELPATNSPFTANAPFSSVLPCGAALAVRRPLDELRGLAATAGAVIAGELTQRGNRSFPQLTSAKVNWSSLPLKSRLRTPT